MKNSKYYSSISDRYVREYIKVWEEFMEVEVPFDDNGVRCHIHHLDGDKTNNDILNLVCITNFDHRSYHTKNMLEETKDKIRNKNKCMKRTDDQIERMSKSKIGKKRKPFSEEHKKKLSDIGKCRVFDDEFRRKVSESMKGKKRGPYKKKGKDEDLHTS